MRKAIICLVSGVRFAVKIGFIDWLRHLLYGHEDDTTPRSWGGIALCVCSLILTFVGGCKQAPWEHLTPRYSNTTQPHLDLIRSLSHSVDSIFASSDGSLWAVGDGSTILKSVDKGEHWTALANVTANKLNYIAVSGDGQRLCAVGYGGTIVKSEDRGNHWTSVVNITTNKLSSISMSRDEKQMWAVGNRGTILRLSLASNLGPLVAVNSGPSVAACWAR